MIMDSIKSGHYPSIMAIDGNISTASNKQWWSNDDDKQVSKISRTYHIDYKD